MTEDSLEARLRAVERAVTDGEASVADLSEAAAVHERLDALESDLAELTERVDALDATLQSVHGYVGEIEHVNERVERRADAARAAVERLENEGVAGGTRQPAERPAERTRAHQSKQSTSSESATSSPTADTGTRPVGEEATPAGGGDKPPADDTDGEESLLDRVRDSL